jgi:hypothetical protein
MKVKSFFIYLIILLCNYNKPNQEQGNASQRQKMASQVESPSQGVTSSDNEQISQPNNIVKTTFVGNEFKKVGALFQALYNNIAIPQKTLLLVFLLIGTFGPLILSHGWETWKKQKKIEEAEAPLFDRTIFTSYFTVNTVDYNLLLTLYHGQIISLWMAYFFLPQETYAKYWFLLLLGTLASSWRIDTALKKWKKNQKKQDENCDIVSRVNDNLKEPFGQLTEQVVSLKEQIDNLTKSHNQLLEQLKIENNIPHEKQPLYKGFMQQRLLMFYGKYPLIYNPNSQQGSGNFFLQK